MKLKERLYRICTECGQDKTISQESFGCDGCKKSIDNRQYLDLSVFHSKDHTEHLQFCSWLCLLRKLPKIETDYFINLPFLTFNNSLEKGIRAKDFLAALRGVRR